eukprot:2810454-Amphidinium_carterae.1
MEIGTRPSYKTAKNRFDWAEAAAAANRTLAKAVAIAHVQELLQTSENTVRFKFPPGYCHRENRK